MRPGFLDWKAESGKQKAESREHRTESREQFAARILRISAFKK